ncbi:MAG: type II toxin-antitoxin system HicA family toxin [Pseudomonadota bacterium]
MADFYRDVTRLLRQHHFLHIKGGKGSHEKWQSSISGKTVIVPRNLKNRLTANGILKSAKIGKKL